MTHRSVYYTQEIKNSNNHYWFLRNNLAKKEHYSAFANSCSLQTDTFLFHSFIATMSYSLQTSFNSVMKDWADKYHVWGTPTRSPSRSNSR